MRLLRETSPGPTRTKHASLLQVREAGTAETRSIPRPHQEQPGNGPGAPATQTQRPVLEPLLALGLLTATYPFQLPIPSFPPARTLSGLLLRTAAQLSSLEL